MTVLYFSVVSRIFGESNEKEIKKLVPDARILKKSVGYLFFESGDRDVVMRLDKENPIFIYSTFRMQSHGTISEAAYLDSIFENMAGLGFNKEIGARIECVDINSKTFYSAKDIEVNLGSRLEGMGYAVDIVSPKQFIYCVLFDMECYCGYADYEGLKKGFIDPDRHYKAIRESKISRAELKIAEAFDEFELGELKGNALDIGASPGGWTRFLHGIGFKVVAVDPGNFDYEKFKKLGILVNEVNDAPKVLKFEDQITHIKCGYDKLYYCGIEEEADLIVIDINCAPGEAADALLKLSKFLKKGGKAIMTIKCMTRNADRYIELASGTLEGRFRIRGLKALPSNRREITLFAESIG
jgi:23S rRNA (cytidine2498-2'-O)-methyltransferase